MKGRNISPDRFFTSISIADWCFEKKIAITGTMRKDHIEIPSKIKLEAGLEANSTIWRYDVKKMLISYEDKKKTKKKIVLVLKAMYHERQLSSEQQSKPQPIDYYDHIKGGVDIINLLSCMVSTRVSFWQKLNMEFTFQKMPSYKHGGSGTCCCDVTKANQ